MGEVTIDAVWVAIGVVIAGFALLKTIWDGVVAWRKLSGSDARRGEISEIKKRLTQVEARVADIEKTYKNIRSDMTETLTVLNGMLMHFISGNDHEKLRSVKDALDTYMSQR